MVGPITKDPDGHPWLLVGLDQVPAVAQALTAAGIDFREDQDASVSCAGPVIGVLRFPDDVDEEAVARTLRDAGALKETGAPPDGRRP